MQQRAVVEAAATTTHTRRHRVERVIHPRPMQQPAIQQPTIPAAGVVAAVDSSGLVHPDLPQVAPRVATAARGALAVAEAAAAVAGGPLVTVGPEKQVERDVC